MRFILLSETRELYEKNVVNMNNCHLPSQKTINTICNILKILGHEVVIANGVEQSFSFLGKNSMDMAFPISSSSGGNGRQIWMQSVLEALNIPFIGSNARSILLSSDKYQTNLIAHENNIQSIPSQIIINSIGQPDFSTLYYEFPCIIKPNFESDSRGVFLVHNKNELSEKAKYIWETFKQMVICQPYISGKEITVSICEIDYKPEVLGMAETLDIKENIMDIYSYESKHINECIKKKPMISENTYHELSYNSKQIFNILGLHDYARIDFRLDHNEKPYLLEVTPTPSLPLSASFFKACELFGFESTTVIQNIINSAVLRYGLGQ